MKPGPSNPSLCPSEPERSAPAGGAGSAADPPPGPAPRPGVLPNRGSRSTARFGSGRRWKGPHTDNRDDARTAHADTPLGRGGGAAARAAVWRERSGPRSPAGSRHPRPSHLELLGRGPVAAAQPWRLLIGSDLAPRTFASG